MDYSYLGKPHQNFTERKLRKSHKLSQIMFLYNYYLVVYNLCKLAFIRVICVLLFFR